mmetsp:Transcript_138222/g.265198  ORF Transcript_138222/g.265198 Transcript_138222/m.265198 type:complete len:383 (-) Transcript_138222:62-1210(-)
MVGPSLASPRLHLIRASHRRPFLEGHLRSSGHLLMAPWDRWVARVGSIHTVRRLIHTSGHRLSTGLPWTNPRRILARVDLRVGHHLICLRLAGRLLTRLQACARHSMHRLVSGLVARVHPSMRQVARTADRRSQPLVRLGVWRLARSWKPSEVASSGCVQRCWPNMTMAPLMWSMTETIESGRCRPQTCVPYHRSLAGSRLVHLQAHPQVCHLGCRLVRRLVLRLVRRLARLLVHQRKNEGATAGTTTVMVRMATATANEDGAATGTRMAKRLAERRPAAMAPVAGTAPSHTGSATGVITAQKVEKGPKARRASPERSTGIGAAAETTVARRGQEQRTQQRTTPGGRKTEGLLRRRRLFHPSRRRIETGTWRCSLVCGQAVH